MALLDCNINKGGAMPNICPVCEDVVEGQVEFKEVQGEMVCVGCIEDSVRGCSKCGELEFTDITDGANGKCRDCQ